MNSPLLILAFICIHVIRIGVSKGLEPPTPFFKSKVNDSSSRVLLTEPNNPCSEQTECEFGCIDNGSGTNVCSPLPLHPTTSQAIMIDAGKGVLVQKSGEKELLTLSRVHTKNGVESTPVPGGRSYMGHDWESVHSLLFKFDCSYENSCHVILPSGENINYMLESIAGPELTTPEESSRLLLQGTFGPTRDTIDSASTKSAVEWVWDQMYNIPKTSHREHYRKRTSTQLRNHGSHQSFRNPCKKMSRWHHYAFSISDTGKTITAETLSNGNVLLKIDEYPRVEVVDWNAMIDPPYVICSVKEYVGGDIMLVTGGDKLMLNMECADSMMMQMISNPAIIFEDDAPLSKVDISDGVLVDLDVPVTDTKLLSALNGKCNFAAIGPLFVRDTDSKIYTHDRRVEYMDNTPGSSLLVPNGTPGYCPSAPKTFLNEDSCQIIPECSPVTYSSVDITLDAETLRKFYELDNLYVYRINGLQIQDIARSPCQGGPSFRFIRRHADDTNGCANYGGDTVLSDEVQTILIERVKATRDARVDKDTVVVLDVPFDYNSCEDPQLLARGAQLTIDNACWIHSHPYEWNVYEFTPWVLNHNGNHEAFKGGRPNPIANIAEKVNNGPKIDSVTMNFPGWHSKERFDQRHHYFVLMGTWGDTVDFAALDSRAQGPNTAAHFGAMKIGVQDEGYEVCGSPGEVANDPSLGNHYYSHRSLDKGPVESEWFDQDHSRSDAKHMIWSTVVFRAHDQLRQRVAFALSSIFVVTEEAISNEEQSESWANYYDIFVNNAFGKFGDVLKQISFSPMMGAMLTYEDSRSLAHSVENRGFMFFPDENFAREIMQLFSIGLWELNMDGTHYLDENGEPVQTYDNEDIKNFARAWTGFQRERYRNNIEAEEDFLSPRNLVDPMRITTRDHRDFFPKISLKDKTVRRYIGDGVQRCDAMPERAFLRKGAKYRFLGSSKFPDLARADPEDKWKDNDGPQLVLNTVSNLYQALCDPNSSGKCQFRSTVVLDENIECYGSCDATVNGPKGETVSGCECSIDEPRVVRLDTNGSNPMYYEYVKEPCVEMAFPESNNIKTVGLIGTSERDTMCADDRLAVAAPACCVSGQEYAESNCVFRGERVTHKTAKARCEAEGRTLCQDWSHVLVNDLCGTDSQTSGDHVAAGLKFAWSDSPCTVKIQVDEKGDVAIIHSPSGLSHPIKKRVGLDMGTYFRVMWEDRKWPMPSSDCISNSCMKRELSCVCEITTETTAVFDGSAMPTATELKQNLHIGAIDPGTSDDGTYMICDDQVCQNSSSDIKVHLKTSTASNPGLFDEHTIFEIVTSGDESDDATKSVFLSNTMSKVLIGNDFSFRNPPSYNSPVDPTRRDALYETDDVLDGFIKHSNTAPFISIRLIKALVSSNPSPRYVEAVATAFKSGKYSSDGMEFGSGEYGDLGATVAAVMLDREARSSVLDRDSSFGSAREPLVKMMHFFRAMELDTSDSTGRELNVKNLKGKLGQQAHKAPNVFSFFLPDFQPVGPVLDKGLTSPESMLLDAPKMVGFINGLVALPSYGLSDCEQGRGLGNFEELYIMRDQNGPGSFSCQATADFDPSTGETPFRLRWLPKSWGGSSNVNRASAAAVIEEMDLVLTGGRLSKINKGILEDAYNDAQSAGGDYADLAALRRVQQLFVVTPEFQITNNLMNDAKEPAERTIKPPAEVVKDPIPVTDYKALVYIFLAGGMDSYSALVPYGKCSVATLVQQYYDVRGDVAIQRPKLLPINIPSSTQPCDVFGLHPSLSYVRDMFVAGDASFIANMGPLVGPITKTEFTSQEKPLPESLFAHNTQTSVTHTVVAQDSSANGVLGRIVDTINIQEGNEICDKYSIDGTPKVLRGIPGASQVNVLDDFGVARLTPVVKAIRDSVRGLNMKVASSMFGETYSDQVVTTLTSIDALGDAMDELPLINGDCAASMGGTHIARQLQQVAGMIQSRDSLDAKRDVFYVSMDGYDTHSDNGARLTELLLELNNGLQCFIEELKAQEIWENVTVIQASEFARTLTSNGLGTDHAWGGNYFVMGGSVKGGLIHGKYPSDFTDDGPQNAGRGRLIPTTPWEALWKPIAEWFGVTSENIEKVLPNLKNFGDGHMIPMSEMYEDKVPEVSAPTSNPIQDPENSTKAPSPDPPTSGCSSSKHNKFGFGILILALCYIF